MKRMRSDAAGLVAAALESWRGGGVPHEIGEDLGGTINRSYRVSIAGENDVVVRIGGAPARGSGIDRELEARAMGAAAASGLSAPLLHADPRRGVLVTRFVPSSPAGRALLVDPGSLESAAATLARVHALDRAPFGTGRDPLAALARHRSHAALGPADRELLDRALTLGAGLVEGAPHAPGHGDPTPGNWLTASGGTLVLIDWEYAGVWPIEWDLAELAASLDLDPAASRALLGAYARSRATLAMPGRPVDARDLERHRTWRIVCHAMAVAWARVANLEEIASTRSEAARRALDQR